MIMNGGVVTAPKRAQDALERAVDNMRAQRNAAQETRRVEIPADEVGVERADTDRQDS